MKKVISLLLAVLMLVSVVPMAASAATQSYYEDGLYYRMNGKTKILTGVDPSAEFVVIPEGYHVIAEDAFKANHTIRAVVFPKSLKRIEKHAFHSCSDLDHIAFAVDSTDELYIESWAFLHCNDLTKVFLPKNVTTEASAFYECDYLFSIGIEQRNYFSDLDSNTFYKCYDKAEILYTGTKSQWKKSNYLGAKDIKFEHEHLMPWITVAAAHCVGEGLEIKKCSACGYTPEYNVLEKDKTRHTKSIFKQDRYEPTCIADGHTKREYCNYCGIWFNEGEPIPATGHKKVTDKAVAATCTKNGRTEGSHCFVCSVVLVEQTSIPMLDHIDENHDGNCDRDNCNYDFTRNCGHLCHKGGFWYKFCLFFWKLFKTNKECSCGMYHY